MRWQLATPVLDLGGRANLRRFMGYTLRDARFDGYR
jgi:hypothetical protein